MQRTFQLSEIEKTAAALLKELQQKPSKVIALHGEMGAGKTTFTAALLKALGSADVANSPTFSIINHYAVPGGQPVYHMDWYRLRDEEEAIQAGVEDCLYSGSWCIVEWPEKAAGLLPDHTIHLLLMPNEDGSRTLSTVNLS